MIWFSFLLCFLYGLLFILSFRYDFLLFHYVMRGKFHYVMRGNGLQQPVNSIAGCLNHSFNGPDTSELLKSKPWEAGYIGITGFLGFPMYFFLFYEVHTSELLGFLGFRCILIWQFLAIHRK